MRVSGIGGENKKQRPQQQPICLIIIIVDARQNIIVSIPRWPPRSPSFTLSLSPYTYLTHSLSVSFSLRISLSKLLVSKYVHAVSPNYRYIRYNCNIIYKYVPACWVPVLNTQILHFWGIFFSLFKSLQ